MSDIKKMMEQFKSMTDLQEFAEAQQLTIISQSKKIQELEIELQKLRERPQTIQIEGASYLNDEEIISREQLVRLKQTSQERELTLEESRKVETYTKIINQCLSRNLKDVTPAKNLDTEDLLKLVNGKSE